MAEATTWQIVGTVPAFDRGPVRHVALSQDGAQFALLLDGAGGWKIHSGPWSFGTLEACAERVVAGDARAITWSDAQLCLAAGHLALMCEGVRRKKQGEAGAQS